MEIIFRKAGISDYDQILRLKKQVHDFHFSSRPDFYKDLECPITKNDFEHLLNSRDDAVYVVENDNQIYGYAFVKILKFDNHPVIKDHLRFYIEDLSIDESSRGRGIGSILMKNLELECKSLKIDFMDLSAWSFNTQALEFYRKSGMKETIIRMEKKVN